MGSITTMNFSAFDLNLLKVYAALMRERSATRAGQQLGMSQPAVSNALNRLRHALNDELFIRRANEMVPTPRAEALSAQIGDALAEIERAIVDEDSFDPPSAERRFTLYGADFFSSLMMPALIAAVSEVAPGIALRLLESATGDVERLLRDNLIDVALERDMAMPDWICSRVIFSSRYVVVAARGHPALEAANVRPGDRLPLDLFCALPHALRSVDGSMDGRIDECLRDAGRSRRVMLALPHFHSVALAVARSRLIAALPEQTSVALADQLGLESYRPPVDVPDQQLRMYWHRRHDRHPAHRWLHERILEALTDLDRTPSRKPFDPAYSQASLADPSPVP
tara:strand:- start:7667 stop:8686 length:1020 start_codon:yes stop_codon:yes gene_type:complete